MTTTGSAPQAPEITRVDLQRHDLSILGPEVVQNAVEISPEAPLFRLKPRYQESFSIRRARILIWRVSVAPCPDLATRPMRLTDDHFEGESAKRGAQQGSAEQPFTLWRDRDHPRSRSTGPR
jgi:hypothetical protein